MSALLRNKHGDLRSSGYYQNLKLCSHFWPSFLYPAKSLYPRNGLTVERNGACFFQHNHNPELAIEMVLAGAVVYEDNGIVCKVGPGELYLVHHNAETKLHTDAQCYYRKLVVCITGTLLDPVVESLNLVGMRHLKPETPAEFEQRIRSLLELLDRKEHGTEALIAGRTYELLFRISEVFHAEHLAYPESLLRAQDFISRNFQNSIRLEEIASYAGVSQPTLVRLFRRHFSRHPLEHLIETRLEFAKSMLAATGLPLKEISWRSGYASPYYFSTAFRKKYGISPRDYRKMRTGLSTNNSPTEGRCSLKPKGNMAKSPMKQ